MEIKGKRAKITPDGLGIIIKRSLEYPRLRRTALAIKLQNELEAMGHDIPEIEVLERKISWFRNHATENPLDKPWNLATLSQYELPPDAVPIVLTIRNHKFFSPKEALTIREAKWIARLYALIPEIARDDIFALSLVERLAEEYALTEELSELSGLPPPPNKLQSVDDLASFTFKSLKLIDLELIKSIKKAKEAQHERSHSQEVQE